MLASFANTQVAEKDLCAKAMVNFASHSEAMNDHLASNGALVQEIVQVVTTRTREDVAPRASSAMLLCNLTLSDVALDQLCGHGDDVALDAVPQRLRRLVTLCGALPHLSGAEYVAPVLQNCARRRVTRRLLVGPAVAPSTTSVQTRIALSSTSTSSTSSTTTTTTTTTTAAPPLQALLDSLHIGSAVRRRGLAHCLRNVCLDVALHSDALMRTTLAASIANRTLPCRILFFLSCFLSVCLSRARSLSLSVWRKDSREKRNF